jgi:hypothetical protein
MPIFGTLDPSAHLFRTTITGRISISDLSQHIATAQQQGAHEYPVLIDARGVETLTFGRRDLVRFAQDVKSTFEGATVAPRAVVVDGLVYFSMARLFAAIAAGWIRIGVFDDLETAEDWLASFVSVR